MSSKDFKLGLQQHGKAKVRIGRVWREGNVHHMVEWNVWPMLESDMTHAFLEGDNAGMTATDTQKNTVYVVGQRMPQKCTPEEFGIALAQHFVNMYPLVTKAKVYIEEKPWKRVSIDGAPHEHGYAVTGTEIHTCWVSYDKAGKVEVTSGLKDLQVCKTTQSGYSGFLRCQNTTLPDVSDRIAATSVTCTWKYSTLPPCFEAAYNSVKRSIFDAFFGPAKGGVYSPSVQYTMYQMAVIAMQRVPQVDSVFLNLPNLHFIPVNPCNSTFKNDVYVATSEPHGNIECCVHRSSALPHAKL